MCVATSRNQRDRKMWTDPIEGDLVKLAMQGRFDVIAHGCNCMCRMRRGVALAISDQWPAVAAADAETLAGDYRKLGTIMPVRMKNEKGGVLDVVNMYTQFHWQGQKNIEYLAIAKAFEQLDDVYGGWPSVRVGIPMIGAGLAGGDWNVIEKIIEESTRQLEITLVKFVSG